MSQPHERHSVRRIVLPSGRAIEVIRFGPEVTPDKGLHLCPDCQSPLVQPVEWGETAGGFWELTLHCPNCDRIAEGIFDQHQVDAFEERLDQGLADMLGDLRRLTQANMAEEIECFARALDSGAILPEDF
ncbi:MAG TPA: hypothetical protein VFN55_06100 [Solirubrobacteraceae bacterium]|nr:hypothetical protein [Solirubrobacteraceae bacterium]